MPHDDFVSLNLVFDKAGGALGFTLGEIVEPVRLAVDVGEGAAVIRIGLTGGETLVHIDADVVGIALGEAGILVRRSMRWVS